jgi:monovalent cation:proton antiporter-2 (CPA2) family protein
MTLLAQGAILLAAAVVAVPLARRAGLGPVLGYLAAGAVIGPQVLALITDVDAIFHFAELGVVLLLFIIGLELQPSRLWTMRRAVFGLGTLQILLTAGVFAAIGAALGLAIEAAVIVGLTLALSSTALALQTLAERSELPTRQGRAAFAVLLMQDLAVIPVLALLPLITPGAPDAMNAAGDTAGWADGLKVILILAAVVLGGRYVLRYGLRLVAQTRVQEAFTAAALLTVVGTSLLMAGLGLSAALGAFIAGVLLADSEYRHALEADLEPFKGLLLGLFFMAVGMSLDLNMIAQAPGDIALLVIGLVVVKMAVLYGLGRGTGLKPRAALGFAVAISQGGEFAFVVLGVAVGAQVLEPALAGRLVAVVSLSMMVTPVLFIGVDALSRFLHARAEAEHEPLPDEENQVIIAGFGRFGQMVGRILRARGIGFTALDASSEQVDFVARYGNKIYYGDASRLDLLRAAKADRAVLFVLAIDNVEASIRTARTVRENFPDLKIVARARNRQHAYRLMELGVTRIWRETFLSAIDMGEAALEALGLPDYRARRAVEMFRDSDEQRLAAGFGHHRDDAYMQQLAKSAAKELEELFAQDAAEDEERGR